MQHKHNLIQNAATLADYKTKETNLNSPKRAMGRILRPYFNTISFILQAPAVFGSEELLQGLEVRVVSHASFAPRPARASHSLADITTDCRATQPRQQSMLSACAGTITAIFFLGYAVKWNS